MDTEEPQAGWAMMGRIWSVLRSVNAEVEPELDFLGMQMKHFIMMSGLAHGANPGDLARQMNVPPSTVTYLVKQLEARKFVSRKIATDDLRQVVLTLTAAGRKAAARGEEIMNRTFGSRLASLTPEEIRQFNSIIDKLNARPAANRSGKQE